MARALRGGRPRQLLECVADGGFRVVQGGVYYVECVENANGWTEKVALRFLDAVSRADRLVATLQLPVNLWDLTVSPGGSTVLYSGAVGKFGDLMMIEHFR